MKIRRFFTANLEAHSILDGACQLICGFLWEFFWLHLIFLVKCDQLHVLSFRGVDRAL